MARFLGDASDTSSMPEAVTERARRRYAQVSAFSLASPSTSGNGKNGHGNSGCESGPAAVVNSTPPQEPHEFPEGPPELPGFRNRDEELDRVLDGMTSEEGNHFWLVIAPPKLGKSWFLHRISRDIAIRQPGRWVVRRVDVRDQPDGVRGSADALLSVILASGHRPVADPDNLHRHAIEILRSDKFHLIQLDSAELLDDDFVRILRSCLSQITSEVRRAGKKDVRLAFMVASRRDQPWLGVTPKPRLKALLLTEFKPDVMYKALQDLSERMRRRTDDNELRRHAALVHRRSEGLPALLYRYLDWIYEQQWTQMHRLGERAQFDQLTRPYIEDELLSPWSLFGRRQGPSHEQRAALELALRALVPYRLFTQSHLRHHVEHDGDLRATVRSASWTIEDLWLAVSNTDLLVRPLSQPWQQIYAPIRRLLCTHWYPLDTDLAQLHYAAGRFVREWGDDLKGSDQSVVLVECLWHELQMLSLNRATGTENKLVALASDLSANLVPSRAYTENDLRQYTVVRMVEDEELIDALDSIGLSVDPIVSVVLGTAGKTGL